MAHEDSREPFTQHVAYSTGRSFPAWTGVLGSGSTTLAAALKLGYTQKLSCPDFTTDLSTHLQMQKYLANFVHPRVHFLDQTSASVAQGPKGNGQESYHHRLKDADHNQWMKQEPAIDGNDEHIFRAQDTRCEHAWC